MEMPEIKWPQEIIEEKVQNEAFLKIKLNWVDELMSRLRPYLNSLFQLNGLKDRKDIREVIRYVLREFTAHFWDLPASKSYHHSGRWGLLYHSLEVALKRADEASKSVAVDNEGNPSAESGKKYRGEQVLTAWLSGLFHDSGKIFNMDLIYSGPKRDVFYHPMRGNILGFKLKHPDDGIAIKWHQNRGMRHARYNLAMLMTLIPLDFIQQLKPVQFSYLVDQMIQDGDAADRESVAEARAEEDREYVRQAIKLFARDSFRAQDKNGNVQPRVFALGQNTYVMVNPVALQALAKYCKRELGAENFNKEQVTNYLIQNSQIYSSNEGAASGNYFIKIRGIINKSRVSFHAVFAKGDMFTDADVDVSKVNTLKLEFNNETWEGIKRIVGFPPPYEWFHNPPDQQTDKSGFSESKPAPESKPEISTRNSGPSSERDMGKNAKGYEKDRRRYNDDPVRVALTNFARFLESGEVTINKPEDEKNIGFVSANDGYFWGYYSHPDSKWSYNSHDQVFAGILFIKKLFRNTGVRNAMEALQKLEQADCLELLESEYVVESHTRFKSKEGLNATPPAQYIRLNIEKMTILVPELGRYLP